MALIRHMREADAAEVARLLDGSWRTTYAPMMGSERAARESAARHSAERIAADMGRAHSESFVAETQGAIVGYAYAFVARRVLWLDRLHIAPNWQRGGIGADLLHAVVINFVGEPAIALEVLKDNRRAVDFYLREGFSVTEERGACGSIDGLPTLVMRKPLARA